MLILIMSAMSSCGSGGGTSSDPPLEQEKFTLVLMDIFTLDATFRQNILKEDYPNQQLPAYYDQVCAKHGISREEFDAAYEWYTHQPALMVEVLQEVENQLKMKESKVNVGDQ